jgi:hypothetical protein
MATQYRSWLGLVGFCLAAASVAALALATIFATATLAFAGGQRSEPSAESSAAAKPYSGMITDSFCGARHATNSKMSPAECARQCVRKGARYTLVDGEQTYTLQGEPGKLAQFVGVRTTVTGTLEGNVIQVSSVSAP